MAFVLSLLPKKITNAKTNYEDSIMAYVVICIYK